MRRTAIAHVASAAAAAVRPVRATAAAAADAPTAPAETDAALLRQLTKPRRSMRVDNILAQSGECLRREARAFCRANEVLAGGRRVLVGSTRVDPGAVTINGVAQQPSLGAVLHVALFKPRGYVCTHAAGEGRTVYELLPSAWLAREPQVSSVGRLDKEASGLLLLTQCGILNARLAAPRRRCVKEYLVSLARPLSPDGREAAAFASGALELADGDVAAPAALSPHADPGLRHVCKVALTEGRHHQLRRMFAAVGHAVTGIHRTSVCGLRLADLGLREGAWRLLTDAELLVLLHGSAAGDERRSVRPGGAGSGRRVRIRAPRGAAGGGGGGGGDETEAWASSGGDDDDDSDDE